MSKYPCINHNNIIIVFIETELKILEDPESMVCDYHAQVSLSVSAIGPEPLLYKWKKNGVDINDEDYTGVDEPTLSIRSFTLKHIGNYTCDVKHNMNSIESHPSQLKLSKNYFFLCPIHGIP